MHTIVSSMGIECWTTIMFKLTVFRSMNKKKKMMIIFLHHYLKKKHDIMKCLLALCVYIVGNRCFFFSFFLVCFVLFVFFWGVEMVRRNIVSLL